MKKYLLSLTLSLLFIPIVLWGQNTSAKSLSSRLDTLIKYQLPAGSNVGISVYDLGNPYIPINRINFPVRLLP